MDSAEGERLEDLIGLGKDFVTDVDKATTVMAEQAAELDSPDL